MADMNSVRVSVFTSTGQGDLALTEVFHVGVAGRNLLVQSVGCVGQEVPVFMDGPPLGGHVTPWRRQRPIQPGSAVGAEELTPACAGLGRSSRPACRATPRRSRPACSSSGTFVALARPHPHGRAVQDQTDDGLPGQVAPGPAVPVHAHLAPPRSDPSEEAVPVRLTQRNRTAICAASLPAASRPQLRNTGK